MSPGNRQAVGLQPASPSALPAVQPAVLPAAPCGCKPHCPFCEPVSVHPLSDFGSPVLNLPRWAVVCGHSGRARGLLLKSRRVRAESRPTALSTSREPQTSTLSSDPHVQDAGVSSSCCRRMLRNLQFPANTKHSGAHAIHSRCCCWSSPHMCRLDFPSSTFGRRFCFPWEWGLFILHVSLLWATYEVTGVIEQRTARAPAVAGIRCCVPGTAPCPSLCCAGPCGHSLSSTQSPTAPAPQPCDVSVSLLLGYVEAEILAGANRVRTACVTVSSTRGFRELAVHSTEVIISLHMFESKAWTESLNWLHAFKFQSHPC